MRLLNSKSILDCNEQEMLIHEQEIEDILNEIYQLENYDCAIIFKHVDEAHKKQKDVIKPCQLHDFIEMIEYVDFKNGIDFAVEDNGVFVVIVYGQGYELKGIYHLVETHIHVMPYDENRNFIKLQIGEIKYEF